MTLLFSADANDSGTPLHHFWSEVAGAGRAAEGLRADWQAQLAHVVDTVGYRYLRFHGLFHDDMFVYREEAGVVTPYFQYLDELFDALLRLGIRPFVEFGFMPKELARETNTVFWWGGHGSPPLDMRKWQDLIAATVEHWIERYGLEEVLTWYFEVWNEPNLGPFFRGTRSEYFELYRATATTVKAVHPGLRVGGPATSNFVPDARFDGEVEDTSQHAVVLEAADLGQLEWHPVWLEAFLQFCEDNSLPVDFVSSHPYPTDWALDEHGRGERLTRPVDATPTDLRTLRRIVDASAYPHAEIHLTEWSSSSSPRDYTHDSVPAATFIVKANLDSIGLVDSLSYWTFTDIFEEGGAGQEPLHGGFGLLTQHGVQKPSYHAYRFLNALGSTLIAQGPMGVVTRGDTGVTAIFYNYPAAQPLSVPASFDSRDIADATLALGEPRTISVSITGLIPGTTFDLETVDGGSGDVVAAWRARGAPRNLSRADADALRAAGVALRRECVSVNDRGELREDLVLQPWAIVLLHPARD